MGPGAPRQGGSRGGEWTLALRARGGRSPPGPPWRGGKKNTDINYCPEGAFCVGRLIKNAVRSSVRPCLRPSVRPCAIVTNQQILGKNLEIRGFSVNFDLNHQKLKTCVLGEWIRIEE